MSCPVVFNTGIVSIVTHDHKNDVLFPDLGLYFAHGLWKWTPAQAYGWRSEWLGHLLLRGYLTTALSLSSGPVQTS